MPAVVLKSLSCSQHSELLLYSDYNTTSSPCSSKHSPSAPLSRLPSAAPVLSSSYSTNFSELETETEIILMLLIKLISGETDASEPRPGWMRVLAIEIIRR
jgi:hypothetical protein